MVRRLIAILAISIACVGGVTAAASASVVGIVTHAGELCGWGSINDGSSAVTIHFVDECG